MEDHTSLNKDGYSPERRNRLIAEYIQGIVFNKDESIRKRYSRKTGDCVTGSWEAYLIYENTERALVIPPCIYIINHLGQGRVMEFFTQQDASDAFEEIEKVSNNLEGG